VCRLPSVPERPVLGDVSKRFPAGVNPLLEYHDVLLRGPSPLTVAQRELLAAYVSGLNACGYCHGAHNAIAELHGVPPSTLETLIQDPVTAGVEPAPLPLLAYVRKLTESPGRMVDGDASEAFAVGWDEIALFHAISICALFNFIGSWRAVA